MPSIRSTAPLLLSLLLLASTAHATTTTTSSASGKHESQSKSDKKPANKSPGKHGDKKAEPGSKGKNHAASAKAHASPHASAMPAKSGDSKSAKKPQTLAPAIPGFADDAEVNRFIAHMAADYGFATADLERWFRKVQPNATVLKAIQPAATAERRSWERYRDRFVNERRIQRGLAFWAENEGTLRRARAMYGVPEELVVSLIGVETEYGRNTGKFSVLEALATLAFRYPARADFFRSELEHFLILTRDNRLDPLAVRGSYAGAIGIPQFMPGSERRYAVDFDKDGRIDLSGSVEDAIGSVASFINAHGWVPNGPVALPLQLANAPTEVVATQVAAGIRPGLDAEALRQLGNVGAPDRRPNQPWAMIDLVSPGSDTEYWQGFQNFFVITRYNRSSFYAMAVFQLAEALREGRNAQLGVQ